MAKQQDRQPQSQSTSDGCPKRKISDLDDYCLYYLCRYLNRNDQRNLDKYIRYERTDKRFRSDKDLL